MSTLLCIAIQIDLSRYCHEMPEKLLYIISGTRFGFESISLAIRDIIALICSPTATLRGVGKDVQRVQIMSVVGRQYRL